MSVSLLFLVAALASGTAVQGPAPTPSAKGPDTRPATPATASVEGCVATGEEVGRTTDLAEKTGLDEHFVLVGAKVVRGKAPRASSSAPAVASGPMYKISGLTDEQLKIHVAHRVRIEGSFGTLEQPSSTPAAPQDNLVELHVATIRQVPGTCALPKS